jgi:PP-loop superfamily ATP-utilizing enzyme
LDKKESKRYLLIRCDSEEMAHDVLVDWEYEGYDNIIDGAIVYSNEEDLSEHIVNVLAGKEYGILIPLLDYKVVGHSYKVLSKEELGQKRILMSDNKEDEDLESTEN